MITIKRFFETLYSDQAQNKNYQSIASYVDGLKPTARKVIHTVLKNNINQWTKVEGLANRAAGETEYLGGATNISGVIVTIAKDYVTSNNIPMLDTNGNFGERLNNKPGEPRYIKTRMLKDMRKYFNKDDEINLIQQEFEGTIVEPKYFVPTIPFILVNGSEGIGSGHAQTIIPRNPKDISENIKLFLDNKPMKEMIPYWKNFNGKVLKGEDDSKWITEGIYSVEKRKIIITELPVGYTLLAYTKKLDVLENNKTIKSYIDESDTKNDVYKFIINIDFKFDTSHENIVKTLKLQTKFAENYTCMNEHNTIQVFEHSNDLLKEYIKVKSEYNQKRKDYLIEKKKDDLLIMASKYLFIKNIIDDNIIVNKKKKSEIISQLESFEKIIKIDGNYDYLLRMPLHSLTEEKVKELLDLIKNGKNQLKELTEMNISDIWKKEMEDI